jgi:hypothetical protein
MATRRPREPARPSPLPLQPRWRVAACSGPGPQGSNAARHTIAKGVARTTATGRGQPNDRKRSDEPLSQLPHSPGEDGRPPLGRAGTARTPCADGRAEPRATRSERAPRRPSAELGRHKRHGCACRGSVSGPCDQSESGRALVPGSALGRRAARLSEETEPAFRFQVAPVLGSALEFAPANPVLFTRVRGGSCKLRILGLHEAPSGLPPVVC